MGGTTKWPYNDSDCLDAAPWFRPEQRHFTCILHIFAHQFWTRAERKGVASRSSHIISMFVWECSDFPTVMNGDGQVWSSMVKGTQWFYLWKRMTSAEFGDNSGLCCTQVWPEEKFKLVADSLIKDILWTMPSMLFAFTVVHFILWNGLLHPFMFFLMHAVFTNLLWTPAFTFQCTWHILAWWIFEESGVRPILHIWVVEAGSFLSDIDPGQLRPLRG